jgi:hypothetical protein
VSIREPLPDGRRSPCRRSTQRTRRGADGQGGNRGIAAAERIHPGKLESLVEERDGSIYISGLDDHTIYKVSPSREVSTFATLPVAAVVGITTSNGGLLATAFANPIAGTTVTGRARPPAVGSMVLVIDRSGALTATIEGEKGAAFNSITPLMPGAYLITDATGSVWRLDLAARTISL